ncbi:hypothetical protein [Streptomyces albipurpureus]|uniref:Uncharacterized protein n=1 Tax=Streptomyces albipurpureus TaxID=2897419 RepID=A0ABT0UKZ8_9ACTN|nr:hypothetical protein [Streptomyces sp. CWNU-1]MCM2388285.1 hypothetical protein [Streptomyces sp. CWNU-1]
MRRSGGLWHALAEVIGGALLMLSDPHLDWGLIGSLPREVQILLGTVVLALLAVRRRYPIAGLLGVDALPSAHKAALFPLPRPT